MNKIILLISLSLLIILGCEPEFDNVIDVNNSNYQVLSVAPTGDITYVVGDSVITVKIDFTSQSEVELVTFDIVGSDGKLLNNSPVRMFDNGKPENGDDTANDNEFSEKFPLSQSDPVGKYTINFYVEENGSREKVALANFNYDNGQTNVAPEILNINIPDTVTKEESFVFTVEVFDSNGLNDIEFVYFELYRPDSTVVVDPRTNSSIFLMDDTGNLEVYGDTTANDGVYSFKNSFASTAQIGSWRFEFEIRDRKGFLSNKFIHKLYVRP